MVRYFGACLAIGLANLAGMNSLAAAGLPLNEKAILGKRIFFDAKLSQPNGQSCASCHDPASGFADPDRSLPVSDGILPGRVGSRNTPTAAYASFSPSLYYDADGGTYVGGLFWDGRAADLSEQARAPFLNALEMHNANKRQVIADLVRSGLGMAFKQVYGPDSLNPKNTDQAYFQISDAIAAYERSDELNPFTSKFDYFLKGCATLTPAESTGLALFNGKANCFACHPSTIIGTEPAPLFTDFTYDNIGMPKNWANPFLYLPKKLNPDGSEFIDIGLAKTVAQFDASGAPAEAGKFKVSTLRNMEVTAPYGHNGLFKTMKEIVHFYNTRDVPGAGWDAPEVPETVNHDELGNLGLTDAEEDALVAFLKTLTDGYQPSLH